MTDRSRGRIFKLSKFQKDKVLKLKENAGKSTHNHTWNPLFIGSNAAASSLANKLGVEKYDLVAGTGESSSAVRMAMAETKIVKESRNFLLSNNVKLDRSSSPSKPIERRSDTTIIVKNLPSGMERKELEAAFSKFGQVKDVKISPGSGLCAIAEMENRFDAKRAFKTLTYSNLPGRDQPLYLEWAPLDINRATTFRIEVKAKEAEPKEASKSTKILVRNVPFQATVEEVTQLFSAFGELRAVRLPKKMGVSGSSDHRGFCFVDFASPPDARRAFDALSYSTHLYGRRLVLEWAKHEESVNELRAKSANKHRSSKKESKKSKRAIQSAINHKSSSDSDD